MPIYEYECSKCGVVDAMQKITEEPLKTCPVPKCRRKVRKLMSSTQFQLKGSGWYVTDYGKGGQKPGSGDGAEAGNASTTTGKTDTGEAKKTKKKAGAKKTSKKKSAA
jgi:putative FmdB family regulatory protein